MDLSQWFAERKGYGEKIAATTGHETVENIYRFFRNRRTGMCTVLRLFIIIIIILYRRKRIYLGHGVNGLFSPYTVPTGWLLN